MRIGLVLSGGGARGAYEVGVVKFLLQDLAKQIGKAQVRFDIYCGTSVGAINACHLAASALEPDEGFRTLVEVWESLRFDQVIGFGLLQLFKTPKLVLSNLPFFRDRQGRLGGLLNTMALEKLVISRIEWSGIRKAIAAGAVEAVAVSATDLVAGTTTVFIEAKDGKVPRWTNELHTQAEATTLRPEHALASAAIPILFPAVAINGRYYSDGGMRQNTPISPALRLRADRLLVIGLRHQPKRNPAEAQGDLGRFPSLTFMGGKILNALLLDHLDYDVDRLKRFNAMLEGGCMAYGEQFTDRVNAVLEPMRHASYRHVDVALVRPSLDLGKVAADHARSGAFAKRAHGLLGSYLRYSALGAGAVDADLLSYLFFDQSYCRDLIELGYRDAKAQADELAALFLE